MGGNGINKHVIFVRGVIIRRFVHHQLGLRCGNETPFHQVARNPRALIRNSQDPGAGNILIIKNRE
jgi:hypothetical protein